MPKVRIAVLGAGYAGVHAAKTLNKLFKSSSDVEVTIYDKNPFHTLMTELHEVAGGRCEPDSVRISLAKIFSGKRVQVVVDRIKDIKFTERQLVSEKAVYEWDYLVMAVGSEPEFFGTTGVSEHAFTLWSYDDALRLREHIEAQFLKASRETDPVRRQTQLTFAVAGAGFTGIEMIGELLEWKPELCREYGVDPQEVKILNIEAMGDILPHLSPPQRAKAMKHVKKLGGEIRLNAAISEVSPEGFTVKEGTFTACETLIWTCGVRGCSFAGSLNLPEGASATLPEAELASIRKKSRLATNEYLQSVNDERVYVIGDITWHRENGKLLPQVVETSLQTAETAAHNIAAAVAGKPLKAFRSNYHGFLVSVGSKYVVADVMGLKLSGRVGMVLKHLVNLHYLWGVAGFNTCWDYLQHHIFGLKTDRSLIGSHASVKSPMYWLVPLRMFLGATWIFESVNKILQGWLDPHKDTVGWMFAPATKAGATAAVHAVKKVLPGDGFDLHQPVLAHPLGVFTWAIHTFASWVPHYWMQIGIVGAEMAIGLALLGGLFTMLAADASFFLSLVFIAAGLLSWDQLWLLIAALAVKGGAGKSLGLDYWVMPWLQRQWNKTKLAKKTYLYLDEPVQKRR